MSKSLDNSQHTHSAQHMQRAFTRAWRVLYAAGRPGLPVPYVQLFADGSARFFLPTDVALQLDHENQTHALLELIGSDRTTIEPEGVAIVVCCALGREED